jgi:hypothetical protein
MPHAIDARYGTREATTIRQRRQTPVWLERQLSISTPGIEENVARVSLVPDGRPPSFHATASPVAPMVDRPRNVQLRTPTRHTRPGMVEFRLFAIHTIDTSAGGGSSRVVVRLRRPRQRATD